MQNGKIALVAFSLVATLGFGFLLGERKNPELSETPVVRTYSVPPERAQEIKNALNRLFWQKEGDVASGSAQVFGSGLMMVKAPGAFQGGIARLVEQLATEKEVGRKSVRIQYWLVTGEEGKSGPLIGFGMLDPAVAAIAKVDGPRKFKLVESLSAVVMDGMKAKAGGANAELHLAPGLGQQKVNLDFEANSRFGKLQTFAQVSPGELVVLGQNAQRGDAHDPAAQRTNVYHVVRVELLP